MSAFDVTSLIPVASAIIGGAATLWVARSSPRSAARRAVLEAQRERLYSICKAIEALKASWEHGQRLTVEKYSVAPSNTLGRREMDQSLQLAMERFKRTVGEYNDIYASLQLEPMAKAIIPLLEAYFTHMKVGSEAMETHYAGSQGADTKKRLDDALTEQQQLGQQLHEAMIVCLEKIDNQLAPPSPWSRIRK